MTIGAAHVGGFCSSTSLAPMLGPENNPGACSTG